MKEYLQKIRNFTRSQISNEKERQLRVINGDVFFPINAWPQMKILFFKKPHGDKDTFKLLLFSIGKFLFPLYFLFIGFIHN